MNKMEGEKMEMETTEVISVYTREDAIKDGVLKDITEAAQEAGFMIPVAMTANIKALVNVPEDLEGAQDYDGRLWDVLHMAVTTFKMQKQAGKTADEMRIIEFDVLFQMKPYPKKPELHTLWLVFNEYEGFTIMKPSDY